MDQETEGQETIETFSIEARTIAGGVTVVIDEEAARRSTTTTNFKNEEPETFYQTKKCKDVMTAGTTKLGTIIDP